MAHISLIQDLAEALESVASQLAQLNRFKDRMSENEARDLAAKVDNAYRALKRYKGQSYNTAD